MNDMASDFAGETLRFGFGQSPLGQVLVAQSQRGVAAILLGDDRAQLRRDLAEAFLGTWLQEDAASLATTIATVVALIAAPRGGLGLPLDLRGTELQRAVWAALCAIPPGETRSYGSIAKTLPLPATAQEVGAACAANRLAVAIPCHRLVKADGSISGYRWGVARKRRLIALEQAGYALLSPT
jgi:AraC family transcriptional regulator of adaptative response/methylated-DNA-[protein]-cysteine methyltransferase